MSQSKSGAPRADSFAVEPAVFDAVLACYKPDCRYLKSALVERPTVPARVGDDPDPEISLLCEFEIPHSCYIDDTGHFNAVEWNICVNQMYYMGGAVGVVYGLSPALADMSFDEFLRRQLPDSLIHELRSRFKTGINAACFSGRIAFPSIVKRQDFIVLKTSCAYWDEAGGYADGTVNYVIVDSGKTHERSDGSATPDA
jgi:hypothetical protein